MHDAFLVIRTVFFALLVYFHVLVLVFASWNIAAAKSSGMPAPGASVFLFINSIFIFVVVPIAYLAEVICAKARPAHVRVECAWTALMSIFQLAASIDATMNGPPMYCQTQSLWAMCASSSLLVHISWLITLIIFSYCLTICITSATHAASLPDIWITPIPHVPWFRPDVEAPAPITASHLVTRKHSRVPSSSSSMSETSCAVSKYIAERWGKLSGAEGRSGSSGPILFTKGRQSDNLIRPTWARQHRVRRGVDDPFAKPLPNRREPVMVLEPPPRIHSRPVVIPRDSVQGGEPRETEWTHSCPTLTPQMSSVFPSRIANPDLPIPRPNLSEWVRADALSWISFHTEQTASR